MPLFHRKTEEEKQQEEALRQLREHEQADQQASLESLQQGGIPVQAQRRLADLKQQGTTFFTSDLTVNEFLLAREIGCRPITQVQGSSMYHVGWQRMPSSSFRMWQRSQELDVVTRAMNEARMLALGRLEQEARLVGADAVVGVHITRAEYEWGEGMMEFNAVGTAVHVEGAPHTDHPSLTNLSGQDFWKLVRSGYWPLGVAAGSTVFYVVASWRTQMANNSWWGRYANTELTDFSHGLSQARHLAMGRVYNDARRLNALGVVGTEIEQDQDEYEVDLGNDQERTDMIFTFHAIGTAVAELRNAQTPPAIYQAIDLNA
jgi:uncharacterized protein YbjQ (UPF0145 family)